MNELEKRIGKKLFLVEKPNIPRNSLNTRIMSALSREGLIASVEHYGGSSKVFRPSWNEIKKMGISLLSLKGLGVTGYNKIQEWLLVIEQEYPELLDESKKVERLYSSSLKVPVEINPEKRRADAWALQYHSGGMISAGVGGAIVGKGAHLLILDDPFKNREEAESEAQRKRVAGR